MNKAGYVCLGSCHALVNEEEYENGLKACGAKECTMKGKTFVKGYKCEKCGVTFEHGQLHTHDN